MYPILLVFFLTILGQIHAQPSPVKGCGCPLPGSEPYGSDSYENYGDPKYPKQYPKPEPQQGICSSTRYRFANDCWLKLYSKTHGNGATSAPASQCHKKNNCDTCTDDEYNPICAVDKTGNLTTVQNACDLECLERDKDLEVLYCGPCGACSETVSSVDCLGPPRSCTFNPAHPSFINGGDCICFLIFAPVCGIDVKTKDLKTFANICFFNCAAEQNKNLQLLYHNGMGICPCIE